MACLNTNSFFAPTGVGLFGNGNDVPVSSVRRTIMNIAGWVPGVSLVAGVASIINGIMIRRSGSTYPVPYSIAMIARGVLQIAQVGIILAPFDIGFSLVRLVREHMKHRVPHHV